MHTTLIQLISGTSTNQPQPNGSTESADNPDLSLEIADVPFDVLYSALEKNTLAAPEQTKTPGSMPSNEELKAGETLEETDPEATVDDVADIIRIELPKIDVDSPQVSRPRIAHQESAPDEVAHVDSHTRADHEPLVIAEMQINDPLNKQPADASDISLAGTTPPAQITDPNNDDKIHIRKTAFYQSLIESSTSSLTQPLEKLGTDLVGQEKLTLPIDKDIAPKQTQLNTEVGNLVRTVSSNKIEDLEAAEPQRASQIAATIPVISTSDKTNIAPHQSMPIVEISRMGADPSKANTIKPTVVDVMLPETIEQPKTEVRESVPAKPQPVFSHALPQEAAVQLDATRDAKPRLQHYPERGDLADTVKLPDAMPTKSNDSIYQIPQIALKSTQPVPLEAEIRQEIKFAELAIQSQSESRLSESAKLHQPLDIRHPELPRHITAQIAALSRSNPDRPVEIALDPAELGRLQMSIRPEAHSVSMVLTFERPETLELMRRNIELLAKDLHEAGYEEVNFSFQQGQFDHNSERQGSQTGNHSRNEAFMDSDSLLSTITPVSTTSPIRLDVQDNSGLDIRL